LSGTKAIETLQNKFNKIKDTSAFSIHYSFIEKLTASNDMEYLDFHYQLLKEKNIDDDLYQRLRNNYAKRGTYAETYLLKKLVSETDTYLQGDVLQILGQMKYHGGKRLAETAEWARRLLNSENNSLRCRAIWVLGWLGTADDIDILSNILFTDDNNENRGWAATAFMQIFFSDSSEAEKSLGYLKKALETEKDYFTLEMILASIQEIMGKKLGISSRSHEQAPKEKVDKAVKKALKLMA
jgi:hypothetical protein